MPSERGELLLIYSVLCIGSCVCGHDMLQVFVPMLTWTFKHADATNGWATLINPTSAKGLFISDEAIYKSYYLGNDSLLRPWKYILAWLPVVPSGPSSSRTLLFVMLCINAILRKQWTDNERLTYPIVQLPLQITTEQAFQPHGLFRNPPLLARASPSPARIDMMNSLNYYYPIIPTILTPGFGESYIDLAHSSPPSPGTAIGWTPLSFYPFMIGLGMFMPLDFLFSCVFFYWFWKFEKVSSRCAGPRSGPAFSLHREPGIRRLPFLLPLLDLASVETI